MVVPLAHNLGCGKRPKPHIPVFFSMTMVNVTSYGRDPPSTSVGAYSRVNGCGARTCAPMKGHIGINALWRPYCLHYGCGFQSPPSHHCLTL